MALIKKLKLVLKVLTSRNVVVLYTNDKIVEGEMYDCYLETCCKDGDFSKDNILVAADDFIEQ